MSVAGRLRRVVLIEIGKVVHADIDLDQSVHLHGTNNVGKSTVIGSVQFLFIRNVREMVFGEHDPQTTKNYYFGKETSAMLFECLTSDNQVVTIGVRNDGRMGKSDFERYIYTGGYRREDYFDETDTVREREEVDARLSDRKLRPLEMQYLPNVLSGIRGDAPEDLPLVGLLPLKRLDDYNKFTVLFKNLLRLSKLSQQDLKDVFLSIYRQEMACQQTLDLSTENREFFAIEEKERTEIVVLRGLERRVADAVEARKQWQGGRKRIPALYRMIEARRQSEKAVFEQQIASKDKERIAAGNSQFALGGKLDELDKRAKAFSQSIGEYEGYVKRHEDEAKHEKWSEFVLSLEETSSANLGRQIAIMQQAIGAAQLDSPEVIEKRLKSLRKEHDDLVGQRDNFANLLGTRLCAVAPREDVVDAFRLINPKLLGLSTSGDLKIHDEARLVAATSAAAAVARTGRAEVAGITFEPGRLDAPGLDKYLSLEGIKARIAEVSGEIIKSEGLLATANGLAAKQKEIDGLQAEKAKIDNRIERFKRWDGDRTEKLPVWRQTLTDLRGKASEVSDEISKTKGEIAQFAAATQTIEGVLRQLQGELRDRQSGKCRPPDWSGWENESDEGVSLDRYEKTRYMDLVADYERQLDEVYASRTRFTALVGSLREATQGKYDDETDELTLAKLDEAIEGIEEKEAAHRKLVSNLAASLHSGVKGVLSGMNSLEDKITAFNRRLSGMRISDLQSIEIGMFTKKEEIRVLEAINAVADANLFSDPKAIEDVKRRVQERPKINVSDLFGLEFTVVDAAGKKDKSDDIKHVHSEGTTVSVKILICIMLLREFMANRKDTALPFYIDEVEKLDPNNLRNIMSTARDLGFLPILASPKAMGAAKLLYHVVSIGGNQSVIEPRNRINRTPVPAAA